LRRGASGAAFLLIGLLVVVGGCTTQRAGFDALLATPALPADVAEEAPVLDAAALEQAIHNLVNEVREAHGLTQLAWSGDLARLAESHSSDKAQHHNLDHINQRGEDPGARAARAGLIEAVPANAYTTEGIGENLFVTHRYAEYAVYSDEAGRATYVVDWKDPAELARQTVEGWMESETHRANLLSPYYDAAAIGVVCGEHDVLFVTQNFHYQASSFTAGLPD
jgi:uncharacterized protein YkwD